jgi:hypothetical protein
LAMWSVRGVIIRTPLNADSRFQPYQIINESLPIFLDSVVRPSVH